MNGRTIRFAGAFGCAVTLAWLAWTGPIGSQTKTDAKAAQPRTLPPDDGKLRIICFGAHPDDAELKAGGAAILWAAQGHHVKFVSVTNGDIGHWRDAGGPLARRRKAEVEAA